MVGIGVGNAIVLDEGDGVGNGDGFETEKIKNIS